MSRLAILLAGVIVGVGVCPAHAQSSFQLDPQKGWNSQPATAADPQRAVLDQTRRLIAQGEFHQARKTISAWIDEHENTDNPLLPEAYLLRGTAKLADNREYSALFDFEKITTKYPESSSFDKALEHELEVAILYLNGLKKPSLGMRIDSGVDIAEEIILRIHERLPFSRLDEKAEMELADFYYRDRDLKMAATAYDCFLINFPKSSMREHAIQRRAFATIAQFKGPNYDASGLVEAKYQVQEYQALFPIQAQQNGMGEALTARLDESYASQLLAVSRWYIKHGDKPAARLTLSRLIHKHPSTASAHEALTLMEKYGWINDDKNEKKEANAAPTTAPTEKDH
jgi:outer membrane protein assembly factor BamD (BamD/ComL family)